jgi:molybdenum cofactor cytidylyltransferase
VISGIILAAGTSSRLGTPKQLLKLGDRILVQHVLDAAAGSSVGEIIVVLGHEAKAIGAALELPEQARVVVNDAFASGQSTSLQAGVAACSSDSEAAVILLGDQPAVSTALIEAVVGEWRESSAPVVRAMFGTDPSHPVLIDRAHWPLVDRAKGDAGLRFVLSVVDGVRDVQLGERPPADVDTLEDYERLRRERTWSRTT